MSQEHTEAENTQKEVSELEKKSGTAAQLFDIRRIIGFLFTLYGVIVGIVGITDSDQAINKAQGININLWTGVSMLVLGLLFLLWLKLSPTPPPPPPVEEEAAGEPESPASPGNH